MKSVPDRCDPEIFAKGEMIFIVAGPAKILEPWVQRVAFVSEQRVDWSYSAGRAVVQYIGDGSKVRDAIVSLQPSLNAELAEHDRLAYGRAQESYGYFVEAEAPRPAPRVPLLSPSGISDLTRETLATISRAIDERVAAANAYVKAPWDAAAIARIEKANAMQEMVAITYLEPLLYMAARCVTMKTVMKLAEADEAWRNYKLSRDPVEMTTEFRRREVCINEFARMAAADLQYAAESAGNSAPTTEETGE